MFPLALDTSLALVLALDTSLALVLALGISLALDTSLALALIFCVLIAFLCLLLSSGSPAALRASVWMKTGEASERNETAAIAMQQQL